MNKTYTAAVVGLGRIGWRFDEDPKKTFIRSHAGAYMHHPRFRLIGVADSDPAAGRNFQQQHSGVPLYPSLAALLSEDVPDCLSIATHADSHLPLVRRAIDAGVRAIWCEKPIAPTLEEAEELVSLCRHAGVPLNVNHWRRFDATHVNIAAWLRAGNIGDIRQVTCYYGAGIWNTGVHLFDLLEQWCGPVSWVQASPSDADTTADPDIDLAGGFASGARFACRTLPVKQDYLMFAFDIFGSAGRLEVMTNAERVRAWRRISCANSSEYFDLIESDDAPAIAPRNYMLAGASNLANCLDTGAEPACTGEAGARAVACVLAALRAAETGDVISLTKPEMEKKASVTPATSTAVMAGAL